MFTKVKYYGIVYINTNILIVFLSQWDFKVKSLLGDRDWHTQTTGPVCQLQGKNVAIFSSRYTQLVTILQGTPNTSSERRSTLIRVQLYPI